LGNTEVKYLEVLVLQNSPRTQISSATLYNKQNNKQKIISMEKSNSLRANRPSTTQELPPVSGTRKVHYLVYNIPPHPIFRHTNPVLALLPYLSDAF
jgi:hypothetical protein